MHKGMNSDCNEGQTPVLAPIALAENTIGRQPHNGGNGDGFTEGGPMYTLNATGVHGVAQPIPFDTTQITSPANYSNPKEGDPCHPLAAGAHVPAIVQPTYMGNAEGGAKEVPFLTCHNLGGTAGISNQTPLINQPIGAFFAGQGAKAGSIAYDENVSPTLKASDSGTNRTPSAHIGMAVRRLTPVECERLQGFPDNYTNIPWRKAAESPDGPRYKALGNSWAVPVVRWIGERIERSLA
jgi:DNA (cytosine-5)-methyltransferase 1